MTEISNMRYNEDLLKSIRERKRAIGEEPLPKKLLSIQSTAIPDVWVKNRATKYFNI